MVDILWLTLSGEKYGAIIDQPQFDNCYGSKYDNPVGLVVCFPL